MTQPLEVPNMKFGHHVKREARHLLFRSMSLKYWKTKNPNRCDNLHASLHSIP